MSLGPSHLWCSTCRRLLAEGKQSEIDKVNELQKQIVGDYYKNIEKLKKEYIASGFKSLREYFEHLYPDFYEKMGSHS